MQPCTLWRRSGKTMGKHQVDHLFGYSCTASVRWIWTGRRGTWRSLFDVVRFGSLQGESEACMDQVVLPVIVDRNPRTRFTLEFDPQK